MVFDRKELKQTWILTSQEWNSLAEICLSISINNNFEYNHKYKFILFPSKTNCYHLVFSTIYDNNTNKCWDKTCYCSSYITFKDHSITIYIIAKFYDLKIIHWIECLSFANRASASTNKVLFKLCLFLS